MPEVFMPRVIIRIYIVLRLPLCAFMLVSFSAMSDTHHNIVLSTEYFTKDFDVTNYLDKVETSSIPESLQRFHIDYEYNVGNWIVGLSTGRESGKIKRKVQPFSINNKFSFYDIQVAYFHDNKKQITEFEIGQITQDKITLDCVERRDVLLGGNCENADFRLLDGDTFERTGESRYLPVLLSDAKQHHFLLGHAYITSINSVLVRLNASIKSHYIKHNFDSPLFEIESRFLLDSEFKGMTLRSIITELKSELPQYSGWYDIVFESNVEFRKRIENIEFDVQLGILYSEKIDYQGQQKYKNNTYLKAGVQYQFSSQLMLGFSGKIYQHYLQGVQPILYTPKTAKFFAHPYGELEAYLHWRF